MISVIVVSYEAEGVLRRCLDSVAPLVEDGHEVWVVDNASSDGSTELVRRDFPGCRLLQLDENVGFGAANNRAAREAEGDSFLLLNPDAWLEEGCALRLSEALEEDAGLGLAAPTLRYPDGRLQFNWSPTSGVLGEALQRVRNRFEPWSVAHGPCAALLQGLGNRGWFSASCYMVRRRAFEAVGGFDEAYFLYFEDVDLGDRLAAAGWRAREVREAGARHEKGVSSLSEGNALPYRRSQFLYYAKHRPRWEQRFLLRRQRRRFEREPDAAQRERLLAIWDEARSRVEG